MALSLFERKECALMLVSFAFLKQRDKPSLDLDVQNNAARLERIAEEHYNTDIDYNQFILEWINKNARDIVYSNKYEYDIRISDSYHKNRIENYT